MRIRFLLALLCVGPAACQPGPAEVAENPSPPASSRATPNETTLPPEIVDKKIAFMVRDRIVVARADGSERTVVARVPHAYSGPYWSEAAQHFLIRTESKKGGFIYVVSRDGSTVTNVSEKAGSRHDGMGSWSPDGRRIVFAARPPDEDVEQIYVMNTDGSNVHQLTHGDFETQYPAWSPDGSHIAFTGYDGNFEIYAMKSDGTDVTRLTETPDQENWATWSPDSKALAFYAGGAEGEGIWVMGSDGSNRRQVTDPQLVDVAGEPNWSRSGPWIVFSCAIPPPAKICAIRSDGSNFVELLSRAGFPYWMD